MVDVGKPYYGQLQKVQGADNVNVEVTAEPTPPVQILGLCIGRKKSIRYDTKFNDTRYIRL
jgi:hypothetical protein